MRLRQGGTAGDYGNVDLQTLIKTIERTDEQKTCCHPVKQAHVALIILKQCTHCGFLGLVREQRQLLCSAAFNHLLKPVPQINKTTQWVFHINLTHIKLQKQLNYSHRPLCFPLNCP